MSIRVNSLGKQYSGAVNPALDGVDLDVPSGKVGALLGSSGAGKSTFLRCVVGLEAFDRGSIEVDGVTIGATGPGAPASQREAALKSLRGRTGLVFQSFELFPHLTVLENCTLAPTKVRGESKPDAEKRGLALLTELGLGDKGSSYPDQLSGGQKQRVAIARALAMQPRVLLYDEPTSALDPSLRNEIRSTVRRIADTGMTQLLVTHDVAFARDAADLIFVLDRGKVVESGPPGDVLKSPKHDATKRLVAH